MLFPYAWTTTELAHLSQLSHMSSELTPQAQRLWRPRPRQICRRRTSRTMLEHFTTDQTTLCGRVAPMGRVGRRRHDAV